MVLTKEPIIYLRKITSKYYFKTYLNGQESEATSYYMCVRRISQLIYTVLNYNDDNHNHNYINNTRDYEIKKKIKTVFIIIIPILSS